MRTTARARKISDLTVGELQDIIRNTIHEVIDPRGYLGSPIRGHSVKNNIPPLQTTLVFAGSLILVRRTVIPIRRPFPAPAFSNVICS